DAYRLAVSTRPYFFIRNWEWYELVGAIAPFFVLWLMAWYSERRSLPAVRTMSRALIVYGLFYFAVALISTTSQRFFAAGRLQPMRSLHVLYILMFLFGGGLLGKLVLKRHVWRWVAFFVPLCFGMYFAQCQLFPTTPHIEWPAASPANDWLRTFDWIR